MRPSRSAPSIIARAMRSFTDPVGLSIRASTTAQPRWAAHTGADAATGCPQCLGAAEASRSAARHGRRQQPSMITPRDELPSDTENPAGGRRRRCGELAYGDQHRKESPPGANWAGPAGARAMADRGRRPVPESGPIPGPRVSNVDDLVGKVSWCRFPRGAFGCPSRSSSRSSSAASRRTSRASAPSVRGSVVSETSPTETSSRSRSANVAGTRAAAAPASCASMARTTSNVRRPDAGSAAPSVTANHETATGSHSFRKMPGSHQPKLTVTWKITPLTDDNDPVGTPASTNCNGASDVRSRAGAPRHR